MTNNHGVTELNLRFGEWLIIVPTVNEAENIGRLIPAIFEQVPNVHVLVVDDSSPDGTVDVVKALPQYETSIFVLQRPRKDGLGRAYIDGFKWALQRGYQFIFEMDADFSHDPKYLPDFCRAIAKADLVIGSRYINGVNVINWPMRRLLLSYYANATIRFLFGIPVRDATAGFKCFRRTLLENLDFGRIGSSGYAFQIEVNFMTWRKGFSILEIPIVFKDRERGQSKMSAKIVREALVLLWKLRLRSIFSGK
jgi:dolichol-phosphate mannosyltransferase